MLNVLKTCSKCGKTKSLNDFWKDKRRPHGRKARCKSCNWSAHGIDETNIDVSHWATLPAEPEDAL